MSRSVVFILLSAGMFLAGCNCDIVCTKHLAAISDRCVRLEQIESQDPYVGKVLRDVIEKEFVRNNVRLCDAESATVFMSGSTFLTENSTGGTDIFGGMRASSKQAIESVSVVAKDSSGNIALTASYDNKEQYSASRLAKEFGAELAKKLK